MTTRRKVMKLLEKRMDEISEMLDLCEHGSEDAKKLQDELDRLIKTRDSLKTGKVPKEIWIEVLKILGVGVALGAVIWYDSNDHTLPSSLTRWIPGPKL